MDMRFNEAVTAYRPQNSCETTFLRLIENWKEELDRKNYVGGLTLNVSKAFNSLCPALLIKNLQAYNLSENALNLIQSYFNQRENRVRMDPVTSDWITVLKGCPQDSTFGPVMWNIFQNDLPMQVKEASIPMYADHHQIYAAGDSSNGVEKKLLEDEERMTRWYTDNLLEVNCDKFQSMMLGHGITDRIINITVGGKHIEQSRSIKILGVNLDKKLNFSHHISEVCNRVS